MAFTYPSPQASWARSTHMVDRVFLIEFWADIRSKGRITLVGLPSVLVLCSLLVFIAAFLFAVYVELSRAILIPTHCDISQVSYDIVPYPGEGCQPTSNFIWDIRVSYKDTDGHSYSDIKLCNFGRVCFNSDDHACNSSFCFGLLPTSFQCRPFITPRINTDDTIYVNATIPCFYNILLPHLASNDSPFPNYLWITYTVLPAFATLTLGIVFHLVVFARQYRITRRRVDLHGPGYVDHERQAKEDDFTRKYNMLYHVIGDAIDEEDEDEFFG